MFETCRTSVCRRPAESNAIRPDDAVKVPDRGALLASHGRFACFSEAKMGWFDYIEVFNNRDCSAWSSIRL
jgi:hypothetical protein